MNGLIYTLADLSIKATWVAIAVLLLRFVLKKAPKWITCALWGLVALRLLLPFSVESAISLVPRTETVQTGIEITEEIPQNTDEITVPHTPSAETAQPEAVTEEKPVKKQSPDLGLLFTAIWLAGVAGMTGYMIFSYIRVKRSVKEAVLVEDKNVYICDRVPAPFLLGIIRPRIYLPSTVGENDRPLVIAHEKAHIKRLDHWWKPLGFILLTVYWFNPVLWLSYILLCRDIEYACDEKVISDMGADIKKTYSHALINCSVRQRTISACPLAFGEVGVKERIKSVLNYKKAPFWVIVASIVLLTATAVCFLTVRTDKHPENLKWAQELEASDVRYAELTLSADGKDTYAPLSEETMPEIVKLINESSGKYVKNPEFPEEEILTLYLRTSDSAEHKIRCVPGKYLEIDGICYKSKCDFLSDLPLRCEEALPTRYITNIANSDHGKPVCKDGAVHDYTDSVIKESTCTERGTAEHTCKNCGDVYRGATATAEHKYEKKSVTAATCVSKGKTLYRCSVCSKEYTEETEVDPSNHDYSSEKITKAATCTEKGEKVLICSLCQKTKTEEIDAAGHSYRNTASTVTCTSDGTKTYVCDSCGDSYTENASALGHSFSPATCTAPATCTRCGATEGKKLSHMQYGGYCSRCGQNIPDILISSLPEEIKRYDSGEIDGCAYEVQYIINNFRVVYREREFIIYFSVDATNYTADHPMYTGIDHRFVLTDVFTGEKFAVYNATCRPILGEVVEECAGSWYYLIPRGEYSATMEFYPFVNDPLPGT